MSDQTENGSQPTHPAAAPAQPGAAPAQPAGAPQAAAPASSNKRLWVVIIVLVVAFLCFCGVTGGLILAGSLLDDEAQDSTTGTEQSEPATQGDAEEGDESVPATLDEVRAEAERMIVAFYPDCELQSLAEVSENEGAATYDIVASYLTTPGFRFVIRADRSDGDWELYEADFESGEYVDPESGALWYHDKLGAGIYALLGSDGLFTDYTAPAMTEAYDSLHPGRLVMDFAAVSQMDVDYGSIAEDELADWDGVSWSHLSTWTNDLATNTWVQVSEQTLE